jgi:predicted RNase H-like HicB family nuclease
MGKPLKVIIEKHPDGFIAYPISLKGVVIGEGDTFEKALSDLKSAIRFHIETFSMDILETEDVIEAFVGEVSV